MKGSNITIAVIAPQEPFEFYESFWEGVWSAAHELGPLGINVLTVSTLGQEGEDSARALRQLLDQEIDAIVLLPGPFKGLDPLIAQHVARNRPVITVFNDAPSSRRTAFVGPDFRLSGLLAGDLMSKMVRPKSHIVALRGCGNAPHLEERYEGFHDALRASKVPLGLTNLNDPVHFADVIAGRGRAFDALFLGCSETIDIRAVLEQIHRPACCIVFDLTDAVKPFLENGVISAVIDSSRYHQGYLAVQKAFECVRTKAATFTWVPVPWSVLLPGHVSPAGERCALNPAFEALVRQRTSQVNQFKQALEAANAKLLRMAEIDPLTGLLNRRRLEELLEQEVAHAEPGAPVSVMLVDLDNFKSQNDLWGHPVGDQTLQLVAAQLRSTFRSGDMLARFGADEFAIVLPGTGTEVAFQMRERVEELIGKAHLAHHPDIRLGASVGLATITGPASSAQELLLSAADDLFDVKRRRSRDALRQLSCIG